MSLLSSVTGILFTPTVREAEPRTFEELVGTEGLTFDDLTPWEKQTLMARKGDLELDQLRALKLEEEECVELEEEHRTRLKKSSIWDGRRIAVTIAKGTGVLVAGGFAAGAATVSIPFGAGVAVCTGVGYLFYLRTNSKELEHRSKQLSDFVVTHEKPQRIIREQLELKESERAEDLDRRLNDAQEELELERQRKDELATQLFPGRLDLALGDEHFEEMQARIRELRAAEQRQNELDHELMALTEQHRNVNLELVGAREDVDRLGEELRNSQRQDTDKGRALQQLKEQDLRLHETLQLSQDRVVQLQDEAQALAARIEEKDIEIEKATRQKNLQATDIQALILQKKAVQRDTVNPLQRRLKVAERMLLEGETVQQDIQHQLFQAQQAARSLEVEVKTASGEADVNKLHLERALERVQFLESQLSMAVQTKDKSHRQYLVVVEELNTVRMQLERTQELQDELEEQLEKDKATQSAQVRELKSSLDQLRKEKEQLVGSSEKLASENQFYREQVNLITQEEKLVRARWVEAHKSSERLKEVEVELKAQGDQLEESRRHLQKEASSREVLKAELKGLKLQEVKVAKEKGQLEVQVQKLREQEKVDQDALVLRERQLSEKENELKLLQESHRRLDERARTGELSNQQLREELDLVRQEILDRNKEIQEVRNLLQETQSSLDRAQQKVLDLNEEHEVIRKQTMEGTVSSAMTHMDQLTRELVDTKEQLRKVEEQKHKLDLQFQKLSSMNEELLEEAAQFDQRLGRKRKNWQKEIRLAKSEAEQSQLLAKKLQEELISKNSSVVEMTERLKQVEEDFGSVSKQLNVQKQEASEVSVKLESAKIESEERRLKLEEVEKSRAQLQSSLESLTGELEVLRSKPEGVDKEAHQRVVDELVNAQSEVEKLQGQLDESEELLEGLQADVQELQELKDKLTEIEEQLTFLRERLDQETGKRKEFEKLSRKEAGRSSELERELNEMKLKVSELEKAVPVAGDDSHDPELEVLRAELEKKELEFRSQMETAEEAFQKDIGEFALTLSQLKSEWQEMAVLTGQEMAVLKRQVVQLHDMNYLLKAREVESQTKVLETQVKLVEALRALNELQKGSGPDQADKFAEELLAAETRLKALRLEAEELEQTLKTLKNYPVIQADTDPETAELDQLRSELSLEQQKSDDYARQIKELKVHFARQRSEMDPQSLPDDEYAKGILEVVKKYVDLQSDAARPGSGLETLMTDPLQYIYRFDDEDSDERNWEIELAGVDAPESWRLALAEEQRRSRTYFKELMAFRTYLIAELECRGLQVKGLQEYKDELEARVDEYLGRRSEAAEKSQVRFQHSMDEIVLKQYTEDDFEKEWVPTPAISPMPSALRYLPPHDLGSLQSSGYPSLQSNGLASLEWDNSDIYPSALNSKPTAQVAPFVPDLERSVSPEHGPSRPESRNSLPDLVENAMLRQQNRALHGVELGYQDVISALDELEEIDKQLEELDRSGPVSLSSSSDGTEADRRRARLEERQKELYDWYRQEDVNKLIQEFRQETGSTLEDLSETTGIGSVPTRPVSSQHDVLDELVESPVPVVRSELTPEPPVVSKETVYDDELNKSESGASKSSDELRPEDGVQGFTQLSQLQQGFSLLQSQPLSFQTVLTALANLQALEQQLDEFDEDDVHSAQSSSWAKPLFNELESLKKQYHDWFNGPDVFRMLDTIQSEIFTSDDAESPLYGLVESDKKGDLFSRVVKLKNSLPASSQVYEAEARLKEEREKPAQLKPLGPVTSHIAERIQAHPDTPWKEYIRKFFVRRFRIESISGNKLSKDWYREEVPGHRRLGDNPATIKAKVQEKVGEIAFAEQPGWPGACKLFGKGRIVRQLGGRMGNDVVIPLINHKVVDGSSFGANGEEVYAGVTDWLEGELNSIADGEYQLYLECVDELLTRTRTAMGAGVGRMAVGQIPIEEITLKKQGRYPFRYARLTALREILVEATPLLQQSVEFIDKKVGSIITVEASSVDQLQENEQKAIAALGEHERKAMLHEAESLLARYGKLNRNLFPKEVLDELDGKKKKLTKIVKKFGQVS
ncbi:hypothetical protein [Endozoicomonas arenosclerae]|uniref:hypothetical protein n=1 Tax=Endozoicomonas arenosclerae TaxID=1633495 RepID=UPI0007813C47|nr:hypothetical protein [Endozoicomonas arenosclerae]